MQPSKQPDQQKVSHPHNSASGKAVSHCQHQAQLWDKNHRIHTNTCRFQKGKNEPLKKIFKKYNGTFQAFLLPRSAKIK